MDGIGFDRIASLEDVEEGNGLGKQANDALSDVGSKSGLECPIMLQALSDKDQHRCRH